MKKLLLTLTFTTVVVTASFHAQVLHWIRPEKTISKEIHLNVAADFNYSCRVYDHSFAKVSLTILKIKGNEMDTLWEKQYPDVPLKKFPSLKQALRQTIHIPGVVDSKEQIVLSYTITYTSKESILQIQKHKFVSKGKSNDQFYIII
jgi:hypothetical protein